MLKPKYIEQLPDNLIELYSELEQDILADMARRLSTYDYYIPAAQWQRNKLIELGGFEDWIIKALANRTDMTQEEIKILMEEAGMKALKFDDGIYKAAGLDVPPISASPALLNVLNVGIIKTNGLFENLTNTTAGTATKQLENALDRAYMQIISGAFDKETSVRNAVKDLSRHGVGAITYPTGKTDSLETAVRRAIVTGVNQTALKLQEARAEQMDSDLVETTAHAGARPSHAEWQGKIFSLSGKGNKYPDFKSSTGYGTGAGLGGWNCRHSFYPYFEGSPRAYTDDELKEYNSKNVEYNGQKMTEYEASLQQRSIERNIRRWKREKKAMEAAGLPTDEASAKIKCWQEREKDFLKQTGFKKQAGRSQVGGYGKRDARLTTAEVKNISDSGSRGEFIRVTEDAIKNVPEVSISGYTNEQCKLIQEEHGNLLKFAKEKNRSKEVAFVFSKDFSVKAEQIGGSLELSFSGECGKMLSSRSNLFVMHNHPSGKSFSAEDMLFFIKSENVKSFSAVGNNGKVFVLTKNDQHDKLKTLQEYSRLKKKIVKTGSNSEYDKLVEKIIERGGFNYDR